MDVTDQLISSPKDTAASGGEYQLYIKIKVAQQFPTVRLQISGRV